MNRIENLFQTRPQDILSVYFTAGYPRFEDTVPVIRSLAAQGADMIEIGIPFSDPMADGEVIQHSSAVSLRGGMTLARLFDQLQDVRHEVAIPLVMMGYLNPVMQYGVEAFCRRCREVGIDGVIIPDLPFAEYVQNFKALGDRYGLKFIMLVTPETSDERIRLIDEHTSGFIYMVSTASTTGARDRFDPPTLDYFRRIAQMNLRNPRLIGFGISNPATLRSACDHAAGAIVGSEFVRLLGSELTIDGAVRALMSRLGR